MEGDDEFDLFKGILPLPRRHGNGTRIYHLDTNITESEMAEVRNIDALYVSVRLFQNGQFTRLAECNTAHKGIARIGEVKFLNYKHMFPDSVYGLIYGGWFQRKTLKTCSVGFVADCECPELCVLFAWGWSRRCNTSISF